MDGSEDRWCPDVGGRDIIRPPSHHIDEATAKIDAFFDTDANMSEEDKLKEGLDSAVAKGRMAQDEADACLTAFLSTRYRTEESLDTPPSV